MLPVTPLPGSMTGRTDTNFLSNATGNGVSGSIRRGTGTGILVTCELGP